MANFVRLVDAAHLLHDDLYIAHRMLACLVQIVERGDFATLLAADQLAHERQLGNAFADFEEAPIAFPPTFKVSCGLHQGNLTS